MFWERPHQPSVVVKAKGGRGSTCCSGGLVVRLGREGPVSIEQVFAVRGRLRSVDVEAGGSKAEPRQLSVAHAMWH